MLPLLLFLIGCATVYVATIESAFGAMVRLPERLNAERDVRHQSLTMYLEDPLRLYVATRLVRGLLFAMAAVVLARMTGAETPRAAALLLLEVALFLLICEQIVPSALVRRDAGRALKLLLPSFDKALRVVGPISVGLRRLARPPRARTEGGANGDRGGVPERHGDNEDAGSTTGESDERKLLQSVVDFGGTLVREVMTPRPDIVAIAHDATIGEFRVLFAEEEHSRIPVFKENLDNILGFAFAKDLVALDSVPGTAKIVPRLLRPAHVVPDSKRVADLLRELQVKHVQSAIVVDEYGGTAGLVTIEDLIEEIVGEIRDEYDDETEPIVDEGDGAFVFLGTVSVNDLASTFGVSVERDGFETVGGYLLTHLGRVPSAGEILEIDGLTVEVLEAQRRRVRRIRVKRRTPVGSSRE